MKTKSKNSFNQISPFWNSMLSSSLIILAVFTVFPVLLVIVISFSSAESIAIKGYTLFPTDWTLVAYDSVFQAGGQLVDSYVVTIAHTVIGTLLSLFVMSMFAFALSHKKFKARKFLTFFTFFTMLFSGGLVPTYILNVRYLNLYDNFLIFILPGMVSAYYVIMLRTFINSTIPSTILEAAKIDGANDFVIYVRIVLPLFKAALATVALFNVVSRWNDWFTGMLYIDSSNLVPLQTMLTKIQKNIDFLKQNIGQGAGSTEMQEMLKNMPSDSVRMATTIVSVLPIMLVYPFFQKYFIQGLTIGSVKG